jgi:hypothetical protein
LNFKASGRAQKHVPILRLYRFAVPRFKKARLFSHIKEDIEMVLNLDGFCRFH